MTSILAFNIVQFFPSLNYWLLLLILRKTGYDPKVVQFFSNYLVGKKTWYCWNNISSHLFNVDISMRQGSALFSILSTLYISPVFHILKKCLKNLNIPVSVLSFVDDSLFIVQSKSLMILNSFLFYSYNIISSLLDSY